MRAALAALSLGAILSGCVGTAPSPSPIVTQEPSPTAPPAVGATPTTAPMTTFIPSAPHDRALGMTVTLPDAGWRYDDVALGFAKGDELNGLPEALLLLWSFPAGTEFWVYGDPCHWASTRPETPALTADEIVDALAEQSSRDASAPGVVTVGGYTGRSITVRVPDDAEFGSCDSSIFASYGVTGDEPTRYHQGPGQIDEFWVVDVDGASAVFDAMYRADTSATLLEEMHDIALSIQFDTP